MRVVFICYICHRKPPWTVLLWTVQFYLLPVVKAGCPRSRSVSSVCRWGLPAVSSHGLFSVHVWPWCVSSCTQTSYQDPNPMTSLLVHHPFEGSPEVWCFGLQCVTFKRAQFSLREGSALLDTQSCSLFVLSCEETLSPPLSCEWPLKKNQLYWGLIFMR